MQGIIMVTEGAAWSLGYSSHDRVGGVVRKTEWNQPSTLL